MGKIKSIEIVNFGKKHLWGDSDHETGAIRISDKCKGIKHLEIALHEGTHITCPYLSEEEVIDVSAELTRMLWKLGYRRPDNDESIKLQDEDEVKDPDEPFTL